MGDKALDLDTMRLPADEYFALVTKVKHHFAVGWSGYSGKAPTLDVIAAYKNKESFGDADFIFTGRAVDWERFVDEFPEFIPGPSMHVHRNGNVFSLGVNVEAGVFQLDFIYAGESMDAARTMCAYFAFNDLGNLMGRVAHRMGLKWGQQGLVYVLRSPTNNDRVVAEYNLTDVIGLEQSFEVLGYSFHKWLRGFSDLEDVFHYVSDNPHFSPDIYLLHNRNSISRARDAKRKTYQDFLIWVEKHKETLPNLRLESDEERAAFKMERFHNLCRTLPEFRDWYHRTMTDFYIRERAGMYFNGTVAAEISGLNGKDLGRLMAAMKERVRRCSVAYDEGTFGAKWETIEGRSADLHYNQWIINNRLLIPTLVHDEVKKL